MEKDIQNKLESTQMSLFFEKTNAINIMLKIFIKIVIIELFSMIQNSPKI